MTQSDTEGHKQNSTEQHGMDTDRMSQLSDTDRMQQQQQEMDTDWDNCPCQTLCPGPFLLRQNALAHSYYDAIKIYTTHSVQLLIDYMLIPSYATLSWSGDVCTLLITSVTRLRDSLLTLIILILIPSQHQRRVPQVIMLHILGHGTIGRVPVVDTDIRVVLRSLYNLHLMVPQ